MSKNNIHNPIAFFSGAALLAGMAVIPVAQADINPFSMSQLKSGYMVADASEAKCGGNTKAQEAKCGGNAPAKAMDGQCGSNKSKASDGQCGSNKAAPKAKEAKCGEAKCGSNGQKG